MKLPRFLVLAPLLVLPSLASADPVDPVQVTTFQAGQPACADDVNQTLQALITAINDNAARVAELEAASVRPADQTLLDRVSGSTYTVYSQETGVGADSSTTTANNPNPAIVSYTHGRLGHWSFTETATLVLNPNGSLSYALNGYEREVYLDTFATHDVDSPGVPDIRRVDLSTPVDEALTGTEPGTWTLTGQTLTLTIGDPLDDPDTFDLLVSADGSILMSGINELETAGSLTLHLSGMSMAVRTNPQNIRVETFTGGEIAPNDDFDVEGELGRQIRRSFRIHNVGDQTLGGLSITGLGATCEFTILKGLDGPTLGPGAQTVITVAFTQEQGDSVGSFCTDPIQINSDDPDTPAFSLTLVANYN